MVRPSGLQLGDLSKATRWCPDGHLPICRAGDLWKVGQVAWIHWTNQIKSSNFQFLSRPFQLGIPFDPLWDFDQQAFSAETFSWLSEPTHLSHPPGVSGEMLATHHRKASRHHLSVSALHFWVPHESCARKTESRWGDWRFVAFQTWHKGNQPENTWTSYEKTIYYSHQYRKTTKLDANKSLIYLHRLHFVHPNLIIWEVPPARCNQQMQKPASKHPGRTRETIPCSNCLML